MRNQSPSLRPIAFSVSAVLHTPVVAHARELCSSFRPSRRRVSVEREVVILQRLRVLGLITVPNRQNIEERSHTFDDSLEEAPAVPAVTTGVVVVLLGRGEGHTAGFRKHPGKYDAAHHSGHQRRIDHLLKGGKGTHNGTQQQLCAKININIPHVVNKKKGKSTSNREKGW